MGKKEAKKKEATGRDGLVRKRSEFLKELIAFIETEGFIWGPSPEIYGGVAGFYTYGPLGKLLKNRVENSVRKVFQANDIWELEAPTVLPKIVWEASGHWNTFVDKVVRCAKCDSEFRVDKLIEEHSDKASTHMTDKEMLDYIKKHDIRCASCGGNFKDEIKKQSLMMLTEVAGKESALRPETATATYLPYKHFYEFFRKKIPMGVFQIGKAYRNEISPRQHVLRGREFTQAEGQIFVDPDKKNSWEKFDAIRKDKLPFWPHQAQAENKEPGMLSVEEAISKKFIKTQAYAWCLWLAYQQFISMGIPAEKIRLRQHHPDEKAFYADDAWDVEVNLNAFGWMECCGVHDRTDYDLTQHEKFSKVKLEAVDETGRKFKPHVLEIAFGTDRPVFALLDAFYEKREKEEGKTLFNIPYRMAPIDVAVLPLMKKEPLVKKALRIRSDLDREFVVDYDVSGSIGRRYLRNTTVGTPYCVTIDFEEGVTLRDRNSGKQVRVDEDKLKETLRKLISSEITFDKAGKALK
jgi:glycyl-tRNA synthetase